MTWTTSFSGTMPIRSASGAPSARILSPEPSSVSASTYDPASNQSATFDGDLGNRRVRGDLRFGPGRLGRRQVLTGDPADETIDLHRPPAAPLGVDRVDLVDAQLDDRLIGKRLDGRAAGAWILAQIDAVGFRDQSGRVCQIPGGQELLFRRFVAPSPPRAAPGCRRPERIGSGLSGRCVAEPLDVEIEPGHPAIGVVGADRPPLGDAVRIVDGVGDVGAQADGRSLGHGRQHLGPVVGFRAQQNAIGCCGR